MFLEGGKLQLIVYSPIIVLSLLNGSYWRSIYNLSWNEESHVMEIATESIRHCLIAHGILVNNNGYWPIEECKDSF